MSRQEALRNDLKALEWLRDRLNAQWKDSRQTVEGTQQEGVTATKDLAQVSETEYADPRKVFRN